MSTEAIRRTGLLAKKVGMTQVFDGDGNAMAITLLKADENFVVGKKSTSTDGYNAVVMGFGESKPKHLNKAQKDFFSKKKLRPTRDLREFRVSEDALLEPGAELSVNHFMVGQVVDVTSKSIGKGFAGGMKRHNFKGLEATHGVSISHRSHGSTGQCQDPGKVFKGKKMAGHLGDEKVTVQSVPVVVIDEELGLIGINGSVPGSKGSLVEIKDAVKTAIPAEVEYPAALKATKAPAKAGTVAEEAPAENAPEEAEAKKEAAPKVEAKEEKKADEAKAESKAKKEEKVKDES